MMRNIALWLGLSVLLSSGLAGAANDGPLPFDEQADAKADLASGIAAAKASGKFLLIEFGANWCPDCRALYRATRDEEIATVISEHFEVVKIDVGNWDKNPEVVAAYDNPISGGIPAVVVVDPVSGAIVFTTKAGELSTARRFGRDAFVSFYEGIAALDGESAATAR